MKSKKPGELVPLGSIPKAQNSASTAPRLPLNRKETTKAAHLNYAIDSSSATTHHQTSKTSLPAPIAAQA
jgi:hypothetical protein